MTTLSSQLRNKLERTVVAARDVAEAGARDALQALAVHHHEPYAQMSSEQRKLRNHLRARARQLGDPQDRQGQLEIRHVVHEYAYEYWHRMLFARFLAENGLLIEPDMWVAISLQECKELAKDAGGDPWTLAGRYAQDMLPQIFRPDDPLLQIPLAKEHQIKLDQLLDSLQTDVFTASDSLGWCYQFWQSKKKDQVNASGGKIGADELPAVTQLFTEDYMVEFLLDNTLGAWWTGKNLGTEDVKSAETEDDLRRKLALPGCKWKYLRFVRVAGASSSGSSAPDSSLPELEAPATIAPDWETLTIKQGDTLPHWTCDHAIYHVCFRLADSIPQTKVNEWKQEHEQVLSTAAQAGRELSEDEEKRLRYLYSEKTETFLDAGHGQCWLKKPEIAKVVADALRHFDGDRYQLHAWSIMPNHVHAIVEPKGEHALGKIVHSWKSFTSNQANKILHRTGQFWQHEPYDHIIRSEKEYRFQVNYVWENPDKAGLTNWPWRVAGASSSGREEQDPEQDAPATTWRPAAGTYDGWPRTTAELKCLDPCCGSGHFLVAMLERLVPMRMAEEGLSRADAVRAVLRDNIHGLEIDPRCTQLAAFALALAAWKMARVAGASSSGVLELPHLNVACSGLEIGGTKEEWNALAPGNNFLMNQVYDLFRNASTLGSLIDPVSQVKTVVSGPKVGSLKDAIVQGLEKFRKDQDFERQELGVSGGGVMDAYDILTNRYVLVATNVPYLLRRNQSSHLREYCEAIAPDASNDLAVVFVDRSLSFLRHLGTLAVVLPSAFLFLKSYVSTRGRFLREQVLHLISLLGPKAFRAISGEVVNVSMFIISHDTARPDHQIAWIDAARETDKERAVKERPVVIGKQTVARSLSDRRLTPPQDGQSQPLSAIATSFQGIVTGDDPRKKRCFWEIDSREGRWARCQGTVERTIDYGGCEMVLDWSNEGHDMARRQGAGAWGKLGIAVSAMSDLPCSLYGGDVFDVNTCAVIPTDESQLPALWAFCRSGQFSNRVRRIDTAIKVTTASFTKVQFDPEQWQVEVDPDAAQPLPEPQSGDPTQWLFHGFPVVAGASSSGKPEQDAPATLQIALARLLGYRWPAELSHKMHLSWRARALVERCEELAGFADADGIVCIPSVRGEEPAADRFLALLRKAYGDEWTDTKVRELIAASILLTRLENCPDRQKAHSAGSCDSSVGITAQVFTSKTSPP